MNKTKRKGKIIQIIQSQYDAIHLSRAPKDWNDGKAIKRKSR